MMRIAAQQIEERLKNILLRLHFSEEKSSIISGIFTGNSLDGVYSHGLNRFPVFVKMVKDGFVKPDAEPVVLHRSGSMEQWDGVYGAGMYNAQFAMNRAIELAREHGMGLVTLVNTNHWMRGGSYGWQAADHGCIGICTTNTIANLPPWGGRQPRLGNNPLVIAVPRKEGHVVLDMALSQFSYGALDEYRRKGSKLPVPGGYNEKGEFSYEPGEILKTERALPVGFWKGSGLSMVIDCMLTALSGGRSVKHISADKKETGISQLFICLYREEWHEDLMEEIIEYTRTGEPEKGKEIRYPGENTLRIRRENEALGIPVHEEIWKEILSD